MEFKEKIPQILANLGIDALNKMQEASFETIQKEKDVLLLAPTGSGKTLGFLLPILMQLDAEKTGVQCLILTPSRELALQIELVWKKMGTPFKVNTCYGGQTVIMARFMPFVRTFAPFVAGVGAMDYKKYIGYCIGGGILWVTSLTLLGFYFGKLEFVSKNFEIVILGIIFISILPGIASFLIEKYKSKKQKNL